MIIDDEAFGAIAIRCENLRPVPSASGASPLALPISRFASSKVVLIVLNICLFLLTADADSHGMFFF